MIVVEHTIGFFGKVSSHGDFVSRRFSEQVKNMWDDWLQSGMAASRLQLSERWLSTYLTSPIWRFCLAPGVMNEHSWMGLLMPSVDRVGRHFPLIIAASAPGKSDLLQQMQQNNDWFDAIEKLALSSLQSDFRLSDFELALCSLLKLTGTETHPIVDATGYRWSINSLDQLPDVIPALIDQIAEKLLDGHSLWWTEGSDKITPSVLLCKGLPCATGFAAFFNGEWEKNAWQNLRL